MDFGNFLAILGIFANLY